MAFQIQEPDFSSRTYEVEWYVLVLATGAVPVRVATGGELMLRADDTWGRIGGSRAAVKPSWSPDGRWIAYLRKADGQIQVWRARADGSKEEQLTHNEANVLSFAWQPDGKAISYQVGRTRAGMRKSDRYEGDVGYLLDDRFAPEYSLQPLWFGCGEALWGIPQPIGQHCTPSLWVAEVGGTERRARPDEEQALSGVTIPRRPPGISRERQLRNLVWSDATGSQRSRAAWFENTDPEKYPGFAAPLTLFANGRRCESAECTGRLDDLWWFRDEVLFLRSEGHGFGIEALYGWHPETQTVRSLQRFDGVLRSCEISRTQLVCLQETPRTPRRIVSIDPTDARLTGIFDPNPQLGSFELGKIERLEWHDAYGNETFGHLVYPTDFRSGTRYPLVIVQYRSRGFLKGGVGNEYPIFPLAARSFLVLSFDRPEDRALEAVHKADTLDELAILVDKEWKDAYTHRQALTALEIIIDTLVQRGLVDPARVGITGLSNGAETVDFALTHSKRFAVAAVSGNVSPVFYQLQANDSLRALMRAMYGAADGEEVAKNWAPSSMVHRARQVGAPLLMQVSDRELLSAMPLFVALKESGKAVDAYVFPNEYHVKWQPQHKLAVAERSIDWFRFWLQDFEDALPAKADQYARWRHLRELHNRGVKNTPSARFTGKTG